jgi:hypothetical protein
MMEAIRKVLKRAAVNSREIRGTNRGEAGAERTKYWETETTITTLSLMAFLLPTKNKLDFPTPKARKTAAKSERTGMSSTTQRPTS